MVQFPADFVDNKFAGNVFKERLPARAGLRLLVGELFDQAKDCF